MLLSRRQLMAFAGCGALARGQAPSQDFEVASIKPSPPAAGGMIRMGIQMMPGGRIAMNGVTVSSMIEQAYSVRQFQVTGGPDWIRSQRYDITAKPEAASSGDQVKVMMQGLLASRFQLKFHRETKELPTYALVVAKGGPKFHAPEEQGPEKPRRMQMMGRGQFEMKSAPMAALAAQLAQVLGRSVIDNTELAGNYDFKLAWAPDEQGMRMGPPGEAAPASADAAGPTIFSARCRSNWD